MICSQHEAPLFALCIDIPSRGRRAQEQIRIGMSRPAVWLAWGSPDRRIIGNMNGATTETWIYTYYANCPYCPYERLDEYFGAPLYDPFCYSWFPPSIRYPGKLVTF